VVAAQQAEEPVDVAPYRFLVAALMLARAAGVALLWIGRPAAQADLPPLSSRRAVLEVALGLAAAAWTGWHAPLLLAVTLATVRVVLGFSYRVWGGIRRASLVWVRAVVAIAVLLIALLQGSSPLPFAR
jgi:hypothetical protein